jgi:LAO/AO transport system kinase
LPDKVESALRVLPGCAAPQPPQELVARTSGRNRPHPLKHYVDGILSGHRGILAQAITLIESSRESDRELAEQIVEECLPQSGGSIRIGITGVPGAGKSSVIEVLGTYLIREHGHQVAVLAIDPSSQLSGGSILGDKTRMSALGASDMAFIRPTPARGTLGGVAQRTREAMLLCEAAGYKTIFIETVGVGQSEIAVHEMVDFFLLIMLAGAGDELQGMKRGVMEMADMVVINKADGPNVDATQRARAEAQNALHYLPCSQSGWTPRALTCSAQSGRGIPELWNCVAEYAAMTKANGWFSVARQNQAQKWMHEIIQQELKRRFESHPAIREQMKALEQEVMEGRSSSFRAARALLEVYSDPKLSGSI